MATVPLSTDPFGNSADARFVYFDGARRDLVARLLYGLTAGKGILLLTGEAGSGRTTLLSYLGDALGAVKHAVHLCPERLVRCTLTTTFADVATACRLLPPLADPAAAPEVAAARLAARVDNLDAGNRTGCLLLDDCDVVSDATLQQLVTLFGAQADGEGTLSILLSGTGALRARLRQIAPAFLERADDQSAKLLPFEAAHVERMIRHRLNVAGVSRPGLFTAGALHAVAELSQGNAASIVRLCGRALDLATAEQLPAIGAELIERVVDTDAVQAVVPGVLSEAAAPTAPVMAQMPACGEQLAEALSCRSPELPQDDLSHGERSWLPFSGGAPRRHGRLMRTRLAAAVLAAALVVVGGGHALSTTGTAAQQASWQQSDEVDRASLANEPGVRPAVLRPGAIAGLSAIDFIEAPHDYDYSRSPEPIAAGEALTMAPVQVASLGRTDSEPFAASRLDRDPGPAAGISAAKVLPAALATAGQDRLTLFVAPADRPKAVYGRREEVRVVVGASQDASVKCFYLDDAGSITQVFPSARAQSAFVPAGGTVSIPGEHADFAIVLERPGSAEELLCLGRTAAEGGELPDIAPAGALQPLPAASFAEVIDRFRAASRGSLAIAHLPLTVTAEYGK